MAWLYHVQPPQADEQAALVVGINEFLKHLVAEHDRHRRGGRDCLVSTISLFEVPSIKLRLGDAYLRDILGDVSRLVRGVLGPLDVMNVSEQGEILICARESAIGSATDRIERVTKAITSTRFNEHGERVLLTPSAGCALLSDGLSAEEVLRRAIDARDAGAAHLDLSVQRWNPSLSTDTAVEAPEPRWWKTSDLVERLRTPAQVLATYVLGLIIPFFVYWGFDQVIGVDITYGVYLIVVAALVLTGAMILVEAHFAVRQAEPPEVSEYPNATAIIGAYLPNEAGTILDTLDSFLNNGYPGHLQIILAYNTPEDLPVELHLHRLAAQHPNLKVVRVEGSTSKAQNVNAVLHLATGVFTGMFDADHEPRPGSWERAWRWIASGYDVVQGHCLTRNGEASWLARMIAVEFESIYAVAHPGRARLHRFGVFGGSNGYWRTELLHETRMRGSMLTEDIDSSMRVVERGLKIRSDRDVVSRELGTTTLKQTWNQRMRWAQGWFQVTLQHTGRVFRSPHLSRRQKAGATYLLAWREIYPWLSLQVFPLVGYWLSKGSTLSAGWPLFFLTTIFVLHIGPVQTLYAYRLADPEIKQHKWWFWAYLLFSTVFYTEFKNTIARVSHIKEWAGETSWRVTPRSDDPVELEELVPMVEADAGAAELPALPRRTPGATRWPEHLERAEIERRDQRLWAELASTGLVVDVSERHPVSEAGTPRTLSSAPR